MKKLITIFLAAIMCLDATSGVVEVIAKESNLVDLADTNGYGERTTPQTKNSYEPFTQGKEIVTKDAESSNETMTYNPETEVVEERGINSKVFEVAPGEFVKEVYFEPVHVEVDDQLVDIDNSLELNKRTRSVTPMYENKLGSYDLKLENKTLTMSTKEGKTLSIVQDASANMNNQDVSDNVILYSSIYDNWDLQYSLGGKSIETKFSLHGFSEKDTISYTIKYGDLMVKEEDEGYLFLDAEDNVIFSYQKPMLLEKDMPKEVNISTDIRDGEMTLSISLSPTWIASSERVFPLTLQTRVADQSTEIDVATSYISEVQQNRNSQYHDLYAGYEDGYFALGEFLGATRIYVEVGDLGLAQDMEIVSAQLHLYEFVEYEERWKCDTFPYK
jgi:hypothetical protein